MKNKCDFSGWATRYNKKCSDGRTIMPGAFSDHDGKKVPLVWNHNHEDPEAVIGHAILHSKNEGIFADCYLNDSDSSKAVRTLLEHRDIDSLSIWANHLTMNGDHVAHGSIRELSVVLAGANPGAYIDVQSIGHADGSDAEAIIYSGESFLEHAEDSTSTTTAPTKKEDEDEDETVQDIINSMNEKQQKVLYALVARALADGDSAGSDNNSTKKQEESDDMKHNVFEAVPGNQEEVLSHDAMAEIISDGKRFGTLKESVLQHADQYGIKDIEWLFPEDTEVNQTPQMITRDMGWVSVVMGAVHHVPFSRIKSTQANLTEDDARAKGYIKGQFKKEEVFSLLKRSTAPTTVYKKQKLDKDDIADIKDFDVVSWLKSEMRMMLNEELARAYLIGDGRLESSDDKINESNVRPIWKDSDFYTIKVPIDSTTENTEAKRAKAIIKAVIKSRKDYKGSGSPALFITEDALTDMLLLEDNNGRVIYDDVNKLATTLRVSKIVTVPVMENATRTADDGSTRSLLALIVNLADYYVGADKGGAISMFEDFDIDYNQEKYLIETRCSGALVKPYSAIAVELKTTSAG